MTWSRLVVPLAIDWIARIKEVTKHAAECDKCAAIPDKGLGKRPDLIISPCGEMILDVEDIWSRLMELPVTYRTDVLQLVIDEFAGSNVFKVVEINVN